jgi:MinD superfamily P-loop ATPase
MKTENRNKRVIFTMVGKGGVGKTGLMVALAEWFEAHEIPFTLLDLDTELLSRKSFRSNVESAIESSVEKSKASV